MRDAMNRLAGVLGRRRRWVVAVWVLIVLAALPFAARQTEHLTGGGFDVPGSQSQAVSTALQDEFGYPPLDERAKRQILGLNAARLYRIQPSERRCAIDADQLSVARRALGGPDATRSLLAYGPRTRRDFLQLLARDRA